MKIDLWRPSPLVLMSVRNDGKDVKVNSTGASHARSLISSGKYDDEAPWSFSAEDGDKLLGDGGDDWKSYAEMHLAVDPDETENTKAHWKYPFGKGGKVYGSALRAIRQRASTAGANAVFEEAGKLLDELKAKDGDDDKKEARGTVVPFARARAISGYKMAKADPQADSAEIYLYGPIGSSMWSDGVSANQFRKDLNALGAVKKIDLRINSEGGDVFDGKAIYSLLVEHKAIINVRIDGLAASAASFIAMAGNSITIAEGAFMMIHNAWGFAMGDAAELRRTADLLEAVSGTIVDVYAARSKQPVDQIKKWMDAETWMTGPEAVKNGLADKLVENQKAAASVSEADISRFRNLPQALRPNRLAAATLVATSRTLIPA